MWHVETDYFALVLFGIMLYKNRKLKQEHSYRDKVFYYVILASVLNVIIDIISSTAMNDVTNWWIYQITMTAYVITIPMLSAIWVCYTVALIHDGKSRKELKTRFALILAPFVCYTALALTNPFSGLFFRLTTDIQYSRGPLFLPVGVGLIMVYSLLGVVLVMANRKKIKPRSNVTLLSLFFITTALSMLKAIFKTAVANGAINRNPMDAVRRVKAKKTVGHRALESWERELVNTTYAEHDFGLAAMTMLYAGLRRGEALFLDVDRDVDFQKHVIHVRGAVSFADGNQGVETAGKTAAAIRTVPLVPPLAQALQGHHGLLCTKEDGGLMSQCSFTRKYDSYMCFLEKKLNGCPKRWYGKTKEHKMMLERGEKLPPWRDVKIRCHDFRVDFCTRNFYAHVPIKTLQAWMGHEEADMILSVYTKLTDEQAQADALLLASYMEKETNMA